MTEDANANSAYIPTKPQQKLIDQLGVTITPGLNKESFTRAINAAVNARVKKVCEANPALKKDGRILVGGLVRRISQIRGHRVQLSGGGKGTEWVTFFDIEDAQEAPASE